MGTDNILGLQDNGYKSTVSAFAEIIDNSIQALAKNVDVVVIRNTTRNTKEIHEILIIDDGDGMDADVFEKALQMGSGTRGRATRGLGKYGQGLPNASISQTKRVEVYTLQNGSILFNHIDLDEISLSGEAFLPNIEKVDTISIPIFELGKLQIPQTGTVVRWVNPNRIRPKTAKTLVEHIEKVAGRIFRYYLNGYEEDGKVYKTKINVLVFDFNGENFEPNNFSTIKGITPFDPMFLMANTQMNKVFSESIHPTSELYNEPIKKKFAIDVDGETKQTEIEIRLSYCKKEERNRYGRNVGSTPFGTAYLKRNMLGTSGYNNISIVRSGREIDTGSFGFIGNVSDPRQRWWSAEIIVSPMIDSIIGIDNKKQQASYIRFLDSDEVSDSDTHEIVRWISTWMAENIGQVMKLINKQNADSGGGGEDGGNGPGLPPGGTSEPGDNPGDDDTTIDDETRKEFFMWIKDRYSEISDDNIWEMVDYALSIRDHHIFVTSDLGDTQLYEYNVFGTKVLIEINYEHGFYKNFVQQFQDDPDQEKSLRSIRLLIGAMVNSEIVNKTKEKAILKDRRNVRNRMAESLDDYISDLYSN